MLRTRGVLWLAIVVGLLAILLSESVLGQHVLKLSLQQAAQMGLVQLTSKGGYLRDTGARDAVNNISTVPNQITAQVGDVLAKRTALSKRSLSPRVSM